MRLEVYALRQVLLVLLLVLPVWGVIFYFHVIDEVNDETDDCLEDYKEIIIRKVLSEGIESASSGSILTQHFIDEISSVAAHRMKEQYKDTTIYIEIEDEEEPARMLKTVFRTADGKYYQLRILTSVLEKDDLTEQILTDVVYLYTAMIIFIFLIIHLTFRRNLKPLFRLLDWMDRFTLGKKNDPLEQDVKVKEFRKLYDTVQKMAERNEYNYEMQKRFIENASHELQTPLAIAMSKLEMLVEQEGFTEAQLNQIAEIHSRLNHIIQLNKTLLMHSRINNGQYFDEKEIHFNPLLERMVEDFREIYQQETPIELAEKGECRFTMSETLASVLVRNLLKNAVVHNESGCPVIVTIFDKKIRFSNRGSAPLNLHEVMGRFFQGDKNKKDSTGLGLAIVKSITEVYDFRLNYFFEREYHHFEIIFEKK